MASTPLFQVCALPMLQPRRRTRTICSLDKEDTSRTVRFRKDSTDEPRTSFQRNEGPSGVPTPNERLLQDVRKTMEELGVSTVEPTPPPPRSTRMGDYSHVRPWAAFVGSAAAAVISVVLWQLLQTMITLYLEHPPQYELYVVQRITAVVRTAVVGLLSLASGISGVTSIGLLLLGAKVTVNGLNKSNDAKKE